MYKSEVIGKGGISAKVVADSVSPTGKRITTFELEYPRFIHSEFMTHRLFSRNAASSRAIPVNKILERIREKPAMPIHWGKNQPGMSAREECTEKVVLGMFRELESEGVSKVNLNLNSNTAWHVASQQASDIAECFSEAGYHKQIVNRLTEPFQFIKVVCTATEYDNFFALRCHKDAQPEIQELAECMYEALQKSDPLNLQVGDWHLPYYKGNYGNGLWRSSSYAKKVGDSFVDLDHKKGFTLEQARVISASCCAQVSYRTLDDSYDKALKIYDALVNSKPVHASPFENQATPMEFPEYCDIENGWPSGVTSLDRYGEHWSGNFKGWIQYRQLLKDHTVWEYHVD